MDTLIDLLSLRAQTSTHAVSFLDAAGRVESVMSYSDLYATALGLSHALRTSGMGPGTSNVVIGNFQDARSSILAFWACCLGRVVLCWS